MTGEKGRQTTESDGILSRLVRNYVELSDVCYRVSVVAHDRRGRFERGHRVRRPHPALLKKVDLDEALIIGVTPMGGTFSAEEEAHGFDQPGAADDAIHMAGREGVTYPVMVKDSMVLPLYPESARARMLSWGLSMGLAPAM